LIGVTGKLHISLLPLIAVAPLAEMERPWKAPRSEVIKFFTIGGNNVAAAAAAAAAESFKSPLPSTGSPPTPPTCFPLVRSSSCNYSEILGSPEFVYTTPPRFSWSRARQRQAYRRQPIRASRRLQGFPPPRNLEEDLKWLSIKEDGDSGGNGGKNKKQKNDNKVAGFKKNKVGSGSPKQNGGVCKGEGTPSRRCRHPAERQTKKSKKSANVQ